MRAHMKGLFLSSVFGLALLAPQCHKDPPSAKDDMGGQIIFSNGNFDDAKKFKTFDEFKKSMNVVSEVVVQSPETSLRYYAVFKEPLNADQYIVQVFDRTDGTTAHTERRDAKPSTGQVTAGWTFAVPEWPIPEGKEVEVNDVWVKPGHNYEVQILKPLATGTFSIAAVPSPSPTPAPAKKKPAGKKKSK
jgi:hypothetical protein